jgi:glycine/D-amino acid oxidase-like deaminating enzyme
VGASRRQRQTIAVLGGGLQGCCTALALALGGARVVLLDRNAALMTQAASAAEGKVHLGYVYAGDDSLATARMMATGALSFAPLLARYLGAGIDLGLSTPFDYVVHRDSQKPPEAIAAHLAAVHRLVRDRAASTPGAYFGLPLEAPRPLSAAELAATYAAETIAAGFRTVERAVNSLKLAAAMHERIAADPAIELGLGETVVAVEQDGDRPVVVADGLQGRRRRAFDHVVNCLWDGRLAIEAGRGTLPARPWLHRFKYGVRFALPAGALPSMTVVLGPFGDTVAYGDGTAFLSWYPAGMRAASSAVEPPRLPARPGAAAAAEIAAASIAGLASVLPDLPALVGPDRALTVIGGVIVAWGRTDIDDPGSLLHRRYEIGITSDGRYHSVDPGKMTMAPHFAAACARRLLGDGDG